MFTLDQLVSNEKQTLKAAHKSKAARKAMEKAARKIKAAGKCKELTEKRILLGMALCALDKVEFCARMAGGLK